MAAVNYIINHYDIYDYNMHFVCRVAVKSQEIGEISSRVEQEIERILCHRIEYYKFSYYEMDMSVNTNKLPNISFNVFEFANKHGCAVRLQFEYDNTRCLKLKMSLERHGFRHSFAIDLDTLTSLQVTNINWVVEDALENSIKEIEKLERKYRHGQKE